MSSKLLGKSFIISLVRLSSQNAARSNVQRVSFSVICFFICLNLMLLLLLNGLIMHRDSTNKLCLYKPTVVPVLNARFDRCF